MSTLESQKLTIDEKAYSYAKIYAALLSDEYQRKRAYASIVALYSFINLIEKTDYNVQKSMTLFRNPIVNEQYEVSDLYVNNWHLDIRVLTGGDSVLVPKIHYDNNLIPDFYVVIKVNTQLTEAELIGFVDTKQEKQEPFDYNYNSVPLSTLINYQEFLEKVKEEKQYNFTEEDHKTFRESYLGFMDNNINKQVKSEVLKHLFECSECRTEFCCFTGFEMVSCNASKYPELLDDQTLGYIGAQRAEDEKYEGKEETIYIGTDTPSDEEQPTEPEANTTMEDKVVEEKEETVSDILDELFGDEEEYISEDTHSEKPVETSILDEPFVVNEEINILADDTISKINEDNSDDINIIDDDTLPQLIETDSEDLQLMQDDETTKILKEDDFDNIIDESAEQNDDLMVIKETSDIEIIDDSEPQEVQDMPIEEANDESTNVQKVIVDYDEFGEPIYSYITGIEPVEDEPYIDIESDDEEELKEFASDKTDTDEVIEAADGINDDTKDVQGYAETPQYKDETEEHELQDIEYNEDGNNDIEYRHDDIDDTYTDDDNKYRDEEENIDTVNSPDDENQTYDAEESYEDNEDYEYDEEIKPNPAKTKKDTKAASLIIGLVVLLCLALGGGYMMLSKKSTNIASNPTQTSGGEQQQTEKYYEDPEIIGDIEIGMDGGDADGVGGSDYVPSPAPAQNTNPMTPLTENDLIPPQQQTVPVNGNINKAITNTFAQNKINVSLRGLNWFCKTELFSDGGFKTYMQDLDNVLKQNLRNNLLNATENAPNDSVGAKFAVDASGHLQKVIISETSGSQEIDNIVLQSINEMFEGAKTPIVDDSALKSDMYYLKVVIKL